MSTKKPRERKKPGRAAKALEKFIEKNGVTLTSAAEALHCTHPALLAWFDGRARPKPRYRKNIAIWTNGQIPESAWEEKADEVTPFHKGAA